MELWRRYGSGEGIRGGYASTNKFPHKTKSTAIIDHVITNRHASVMEPLLNILATHEINPQAHGYLCSFHLSVFVGYQIQGNVCALTRYSRFKDTLRQEARIEMILKDSIIDEIKGRSLDRTWLRVPIALT
jgi:hypothetical protein